VTKEAHRYQRDPFQVRVLTVPAITRPTTNESMCLTAGRHVIDDENGHQEVHADRRIHADDVDDLGWDAVGMVLLAPNSCVRGPIASRFRHREPRCVPFAARLVWARSRLLQVR